MINITDNGLSSQYYFLHFTLFSLYNFNMEKKEYTFTVLEDKPLTDRELLSGAYDEEILKRMERVVRTEGPVRESLLYKRVLNSFSLHRNGALINALLTTLSSTLQFPVTTDLSGEKVFHTGGDEDYFRPTPDGKIRYSYQIPDIEGANAVLYILGNGVKASYTKSELYSLFKAELGYLKSGDRLEELFGNALRDGRIKRSGNGRILK